MINLCTKSKNLNFKRKNIKTQKSQVIADQIIYTSRSNFRGASDIDNNLLQTHRGRENDPQLFIIPNERIEPKIFQTKKR